LADAPDGLAIVDVVVVVDELELGAAVYASIPAIER
jgi:hypothetical protein